MRKLSYMRSDPARLSLIGSCTVYCSLACSLLAFDISGCSQSDPGIGGPNSGFGGMAVTTTVASTPPPSGTGGMSNGTTSSPTETAAGAGAVGVTSSIAALRTCTLLRQIGGVSICHEGWSHRSSDADCPSMLPRDGDCGSDRESTLCRTDADCSEQPNGYCHHSMLGMYDDGCSCRYGCVRDSDCSAGMICFCDDPVGTCLPASCRTDADCTDGFCASYDSYPTCHSTNLACTTAQDECTSDSDCGKLYCLVGEKGYRVCERQSCSI
jgi:hypothetical protein